MKTFAKIWRRAWLVGLIASAVGELTAVPRADVLPPERRRGAVELAQRLARQQEPTPLPAELVVPFRPPGFDEPDPAEIPPATAGGPRVATSREILETIVSKIEPSGTIILGGQPILLFGQKRLKVGDKLTVTLEGTDYELDITGIERTTFTLRLHQDEITRPIKPGKSP